MDTLIIEAGKDTPYVHLDKNEGIFEISKLSLPEDAITFYTPVMKWLDEYSKNPNDETVFSFKLEYFNTASSKQIIQILLLLQKINEKKTVKIKWYYKEIDEDMLSLGEEYAEVIDVHFEFIPY